jgi:hypothetical protein
MKKIFYSFFTFIIFFNCSESTKKSEKLTVAELTNTEEYVNASPEKKKIFLELQKFQQDLQNKKTENVSNSLGCPKRIQELDLEPKNSVVRNNIESNSFRLSSTLVQDNYDLVYNELDLAIINDAVKSIDDKVLLSKDNNSTTVRVGDCTYHVDINLNNNEVDFTIKSVSTEQICKKDQKWKFISTDGILVLDHRKML